MPAIDLNLGFYQIAKHYYFPGWHQQSTILRADDQHGQVECHERSSSRSWSLTVACRANIALGHRRG
jgi:TRAP-type mannitol/chloroaromatic compound transport system substrate-binding protein